MSNRYYDLYQKSCNELEQMMIKYQGRSEDAKKLKGAIAVYLLKKEIEKYFKDNNKLFKVSKMNSYIAGSKFEYDLLLVKKNAEPFMELVYDPNDVVAVIESKARGLFNVDSETDNIANAVNRAQEINPDIRFGYITISENVPVHPYKNDGTLTVNHWDLTEQCIIRKVKGFSAIYAVTLHQGKALCDEGSDNEFNEFLECLTKM